MSSLANNDFASQLDGFDREVLRCLENFTSSEWLATHSTLASPYMLGDLQERFAANQAEFELGITLQQVLLSAADRLTTEQQRFLKLAYFERKPAWDSERVAFELGISRRTFFRFRIEVVQALANHLNQILRPTLRQEFIGQHQIIGREEMIQRGVEALLQGNSLTIAGESGIGKTALGTAITQAWLNVAVQPNLTGSPIFWLSFRSGLNDHLSSLIFSLAHFLHQHRFSNSWRQIVADKGKTDLNRLLGLIRFDLDRSSTLPLLFCLDDMEVLQPELEGHLKILNFLEELCAITRVMLMGQRILIPTPEQIILSGLSIDEMRKFFHETESSKFADSTLITIAAKTHGNPALLTLLQILVRSGDLLDIILYDLIDNTSLESFFYRIWRKITAQQRLLLMQMAVFRTASPLQCWTDQQSELDSLLARHILEMDGQGGVRIFPHIHKFVYEKIPSELVTELHIKAGMIRSQLGEFLSALYHFIRGQKPSYAIWAWFPHRQVEIERGHGEIALRLFNSVDESILDDERDRATLRVARSQLLQLSGNAEIALQELANLQPTNDEFGIYFTQLRGDIQEMYGQLELSAKSYREALNMLTGLPQMREVTLHTKLGFLSLYRLHDIKTAEQEAIRSRIKAESFHGQIKEINGDYQDAQRLYESARELAESTNIDLETLSRVYTHASTLALKLNKLDESINYCNKAIECDLQRGDSVSPLYDIMNLAYVYTISGRYQDAYQKAREGLFKAEGMRHSYLVAGLAAGVGEACYYLQNYEEAEHYTLQSLNQEEEFFRSWALILLGKIRHKQGNSNVGIDLIQQGLLSAHEIGDKHVEELAQDSLKQIYADLKEIPLKV